MIIKLSDVKIYNKDLECFETGDLFFENGIVCPKTNNFDQEINCMGNILIPGFRGCYGKHIPFLMEKLENFKWNYSILSDILCEYYFSNGYCSITQEIENLEIAKELSTRRLLFHFVVENVSLAKKIKKLGKANLKISMKVLDVFEPDSSFDEVLNYALKENLDIYASIFSNLEELGKQCSKQNKTAIQLAEKSGVLDGKLHLLNNIYLDKEDIVEGQNFDIEYLISPSDNLILGRGVEPVATLNNLTAKIGFSQGETLISLDMFEQMRMAIAEANSALLDNAALTSLDVLSFATKKKFPRLEVGDLANFLIIDSSKFLGDKITICDLVLLTKSGDIIQNYVAGQIVYDRKNPALTNTIKNLKSRGN